MGSVLNENVVSSSEYLWRVPIHKQRWKEIAAEDGTEDGLYGRFCHHLETDAIYLLNDAMELLPKVSL